MDTGPLIRVQDHETGSEHIAHGSPDDQESHDITSQLDSPNNGHHSQNNGYAPLEDVSSPEVSDAATHTGQYHPHPVAPSLNSDNASLWSNGRRYDHRQSRKFLLWTGFNRFCVTLAFCIAIGLILRGFEGFDEAHPRILTNSEVKSFNAIMVGISIGLGMNIASSLKHYGLILRWSFLTREYVPLPVFDLILGCENLTNVFKLMLISLPGIDRYPVLRFLRLKGRIDTSKVTSLVCLLWLLFNAGAQVLVASLSIFWPVAPSENLPLFTRGDVSISDLSAWQKGGVNMLQISAANAYGMAGAQYPTISIGDEAPQDDGVVIMKGEGYYEYNFLNRNPDSPHSNFAPSSRTVRSQATCQQFSFDSTAGNKIDGFITGSLDGGQTFDEYIVLHTVRGQISWTAMRSADFCGPRCATVFVYQKADNKTIMNNSMFMCNSTIEPITSSNPNEFRNIKDDQKPLIYSTDEFAHIAAGSIAWTGYVENGLHDRQGRVYISGMPFSPYEILNTDLVESILSRFTIGAIAAFDDHGPRINLPDQTNRPSQGQRLDADWARILIIMAFILIIQFTAFIALLAFANKSIIRDESYLSVAMLLSGVVGRIPRGEAMNLSGEEIYLHPNLADQKIKYDYKKINAAGRRLRMVDISFEGEDPSEKNGKRRYWDDGEYI